MTLRLAWFATAKGTGSRLLFQRAAAAIAQRELDAEIAVVFCNRERGQSPNTDAFLDTVEAAGLPLVTISSAAWRKRSGGETARAGEALPAWRHEFDRAVWEAVAPHAPAVGVLAGYRLIASEELCGRLPLFNLHPAAPQGPVGTWQEVVRELIDSCAQGSGIVTQRATSALDMGPILTSCRYSIRGGALEPLWAERSGPASEEEPLFKAIRAAGVQREPPFLIASLQALATGRATMPAADEPGPNLALSAEVEAALGRAGD